MEKEQSPCLNYFESYCHLSKQKCLYPGKENRCHKYVSTNCCTACGCDFNFSDMNCLCGYLEEDQVTFDEENVDNELFIERVRKDFEKVNDMLPTGTYD